MPTREEMLAEAEAEIRKVGDVLDKLERDRAAAHARSEEIQDESFSTPEEEADISARVDAVERDIERLSQEISEAEDDLGRAQATWEDYNRGASDDEDDGDDESLSVHDAADIWRSRGMDEDYMFGYSEDELRRAAGMG